MAFIVNDRVKESSSTTGTGAFTLSGAPSNYLTFNVGVGVGSNTWYCINNLSANEWEVGYGLLSGTTTLTRLLVTASTSGTSFVNFSAGTKEVFVTLPSAFNNQTLGRTNMIINPHGSIQQETTTPVTATGYFADQWHLTFGASGGAVSIFCSTGGVSVYDPFHMNLKTTTAQASLAASDIYYIDQKVEGFYSRRLRYGSAAARGSWLRWRASASQSGTASVSIREASGTRSFVQSFDVTTTPTDYFLYVPGDTSGTWQEGISAAAVVSFCAASGTTAQTSTLGAWQAGNFIAANTQSNMLDTVNRQLNITDVQWSASDVLLPFEPIDYQQELARCQRYLEVWPSTGINLSGFGNATNILPLPVYFRVTKRVIPSIVDLGTQTTTNCSVSSTGATTETAFFNLQVTATGPFLYNTSRAVFSARM